MSTAAPARRKIVKGARESKERATKSGERSRMRDTRCTGQGEGQREFVLYVHTRMGVCVRSIGCVRVCRRREPWDDVTVERIIRDGDGKTTDNAHMKYLIRNVTSSSRHFPCRNRAAVSWSLQSPGRDTSPFLSRRPSWLVRYAHTQEKERERE